MSLADGRDTFSDLSQLSKSIVVEKEPEAQPQRPAPKSDAVPSLLGEMMGVPPVSKAPPPPSRRADAATQAQSARSEAAAYEEALQEMAQEKVEVEMELEAAMKRVEELEASLAALASEKASLEGRLAAAERRAGENEAASADLARVKDELAKVQSAQAAKIAEAEEKVRAAEERFRLELEEARAHSASVSVLLDRPEEFPEVFAGEVREHVLATLKEAFAAAEGGGRERRAGVLEAVIAANPSTGELERRRAEVKRIVREGGRFVDDSVIAELGRLGFRHVSGSNHHKLVYAGVRIALSKTPSDNRAVLNNSTEINNLVY